MAAKRYFDDRLWFVFLGDTGLEFDLCEDRISDRLSIFVRRHVNRHLLKRPVMIVVNVRCRDLIPLINLDNKCPASLAKFTDIRHLDRAGIERPIVDLVSLMSVAEADVFDCRFELFQGIYRQRRYRMNLMPLDIGVEHQNVESTFAAVLLDSLGQHRDRPVARGTIPIRAKNSRPANVDVTALFLRLIPRLIAHRCIF